MFACSNCKVQVYNDNRKTFVKNSNSYIYYASEDGEEKVCGSCGVFIDDGFAIPVYEGGYQCDYCALEEEDD